MPKLDLLFAWLKLGFPSIVIYRVARFGENKETRIPT